MTLTDKTQKGQSDAIAFEIELSHSPQKVWRAISEPALLSQWLLPVLELKLAPGAVFRFKTDPHPGWDGVVNCRVIEVDAPRVLRYAWVVGEALDTIVTFTLAPTETGTRLSIVQSGFKPDQKQNFGGARYGWKMMGERLIAVLAQT